MAKRKTTKVELKEMNPAEAVRQGWLAYLGAYGMAFDRARPAIEKLQKRSKTLFGDLVDKGEEVEATAKEQMEDARERAKGFYGAGYEKVRELFPAEHASKDRVAELEEEVATLNRKIATLSKTKAKKAAPRAKRAKAA